jgi:tRNA(His) guanylyltransferase
MMRDDLGDRMKQNYENRTRYYLPRRTYMLIRVDGKAFHAYTRHLKRPYDLDLMADMDHTAKTLCEQVAGARLAFVQSDEISLLVTDFDSPQTEAWFDGNLQKMVSLSASIATAAFNRARLVRAFAAGEVALDAPQAHFDSRVFTIPDATEVENYFIWRQQDASRNSVSMAAHAYLSHGRLQGVGNSAMQELLFQEHGINWNDYPTGYKRGRAVIRTEVVKDVVYTDKRTGEEQRIENVARHLWEVVTELPIFTQDRDWLQNYIPRHAGLG